MSEQAVTPFIATPEQLQKAQSFISEHIYPEVFSYDDVKAYSDKQFTKLVGVTESDGRVPFWLRRTFDMGYAFGAVVECSAYDGENFKPVGLLDVDHDGELEVTLVVAVPQEGSEEPIPEAVWTKPFSLETIAEGMVTLEDRASSTN